MSCIIEGACVAVITSIDETKEKMDFTKLQAAGAQT